jgi:tetraacyldisaccharide 4'-kinase
VFDASTFRELVSGRRDGVGAAAARALLRIIETPYTLAINRRNRRYDRGRAEITSADVPVVSVGNLSLGGTGKTPLVKWLARWFCQRGVSVAIVSRGYGARQGQSNDEARELALALPDVPHLQNRDRVAAARSAVKEFRCQLVLLDDGFQHRRLARDLDIVLLDALEPFGFGHVFPRGTLREPARNLNRAQVVCLSRADAISPAERDAIRLRVAELAPHAAWCELAHRPSQLINSAGETQPLDALRDRRVAAFCGIGNPAGFRHTLAATGCSIVAWREFPDHHAYVPADLSALTDVAQTSQAELIACTQKDLVKIQQPRLGNLPLWAVAIEMQFLTAREDLEHALERVCPPPSTLRPPP